MKEKSLKTNKKGITLIALIITIIILLILAGVSISMISGENGILTQAKNAKEKYEEASRGEQAIANGYLDTTTGQIVPIPEEFYYVGGTVNSGVVISDNSTDKDKYADKSDVGTDLQGNQFVWIPVDGTNLTYSQDHTYDNVHQYKYGYKDLDNKFIKYEDWKDEGKDEEGNELENEITIEKRKSSVEKYGGFYVARYEAGVPSNAQFYADSSGDTYYTASTVISKNVAEYIPVSKAEVPSWNYITQTNAKIVSANMYKNHNSVTSSLIDSYAWDTICNWLIDKKLITDTSEGKIDSTNYGNYYNSTFQVEDTLFAEHQYINYTWTPANIYSFGTINLPSGSGTNKVEIATGTSSITKLNNIYDIAGNMWEWTTETGKHEEPESSNTYAVIRGGSFNVTGTSSPIVYRDGNNTVSGISVHFGFRPVLYIN